ncbi:MAG: 2-hydroxy-3-oxopropionate reductase [Epulopiscium sp.]|nr:2-hydroxy-3-oxopropionate reductase [Candidatus Epulonipiscium sp.]
MIIGFIGLGIMGKPMVNNLLKAGHQVIVFDIIEENIKEVVELGAVAASSGKELAKQVNMVITMLPNSPHVREAVLGKDGILEGAKAGDTLIDMSSIAPLESQKIHSKCAEKGVKMIDAPVSGGEPKAIDGSLSIMVGGDKDVFDQVYDILMLMGSSAVYCGNIGAGNTTKLANQIIVGVNIAAVSEALMLASRAGVDPKLVFEAIRGGLAGSTVLDAKAPMMLQGNYQPGFKIDLHIKDLENALETGQGVDSPLPLASQVIEMMEDLHRDGCGQDDHSALAKYYEKISGSIIAKE